MYAGDRSRKENLVNYGFRLPCALDNRPLKFGEFEGKMPTTLFASATPADYELRKCGGVVVEQIIRPTGLLDPKINVRQTKGQIDDILNEVAERNKRGERTLITTLTKRSAEDLTDYLLQAGLKVRYMHSDTDTLTRSEIVKELREGIIDILVGINLLREGLDLPEVSLVVILDADKEGFLRSNRSLIQTIGRAARHLNGSVILYADKMTDSMKYAISETENRRRKQEESNRRTGMVPRSVQREIHKHLQLVPDADYSIDLQALLVAEEDAGYQAGTGAGTGKTKKGGKSATTDIESLRKQMREAAANLEFEKAAYLRDHIRALEKE
jgi:excinuclease ABC subunit B